MTTEQLIAGLLDIEQGRIPADCVIDMVPDLTLKLSAIIRYQRRVKNKKSKDFNDNLILNEFVKSA